MDRYLLLALLALVVCLSAPGSARADLTLPPGFSKVTLASGLADPVAMAYAPDGRLFVAEKAGRLRVITAGGSLLSAPVIDISDHVATQGDRGLLGIAVDSAYATNHYVYLLYTHDTDQANPVAEKTARLTRIEVLPDNTLAGPERVLLGTDATVPCPPASNTSDCIPSSSDSHSIGTVRSDPDGTLWVGSGDGAEYNWTDVNSLRALDEQSLAGKILHVDREGRGLPGHQFCPGEDDLDLVCTKLYAKGFRNPFRFHLRPGAGPIVGDVGWGLTEEIDAVGAGKSYGWPCYEGSERAFNYQDMPECQAEYARPHEPPVYTYPHVNGGGAVVAGPRYTGTRYPVSYRGAWFVGDYVHGWIRVYNLVGDQPVEDVRPFASDWSGVDLETTPQGDLAYVSFGDGSANSGSIERISYGNAAPPAKANATPESGSAPLEVDFSADVSDDPDGDVVSYEWDFDSNGTKDADGRTATHTYATRGARTATLTVRDARGLYSQDTVVVAVDDTPPVATIHAPADGALFRHGVPVQLRGTGYDNEDPVALTWRLVLHHGEHIHPAGTDLHGAEESFTPAGDHDADSYYEVQFSATDGFRTDTKSVDIRPETIKLTLASEPPGVPLSYSGREYTAPASLTSAIGYRTSISAPETVSRGGVIYRFSGWSDGGGRLHKIVVPAANRTLTARYRAASGAGGAGGAAALEPRAATLLGPRPRPRLRLDRPGRRARSLSGRVQGVASAPRVHVALRTTRSGGRCRRWDADRGRLGRRVTRCGGGHAWMRAAVTRRPGASPDWNFRARLRGAPRAGRYVLTTRVTDKRGRTLLGPSSSALRLR